MKKVLLMMLGVLMALPAFAADWGYEVVSDTPDNISVRLTSLPDDYSDTELIIPATIEVDGHIAQVSEIDVAAIPEGKTFSSLRIEDSSLPLIQNGDLSKRISCATVYIGRNIQAAAGYDEALYGYNRITDVTFGKDITKIPAKMFMGAIRIPAIDLSETKVDAIGDFAFSKVSLLAELKLPATLNYIGVQAFDGTRIPSLNLPSSLQEIDNGAFLSCGRLESVEFHSHVDRIGEEAFASCDKLSSIVFESPVGTVENRAFADLTLPSLHVKADTIKAEAFANIKITDNLSIESTVVETEAFKNITAGKAISIVAGIVPAGVCSGGIFSDLNSIEIQAEEISGNPFDFTDFAAVDYFHIKANVIANKSFEQITFGEGADIDINATQIKASAFSGMKVPNAKRFCIKATEVINAHAFGDVNITSDSTIYISAGDIKSYAFYKFGRNDESIYGLTVKVNIDNFIREDAFVYAWIKELFIEGDGEIQENCLRECFYLSYLYLNMSNIAASLGIGNSVYSDKDLKTVEFGDKVKRIPIFRYCANLANVKFNNCRLDRVYGSAFKGTSVSSIVFPTIEGAEPTCIVDDEAFNTGVMKNVDLGNTVKSLGAKCIRGKLQSVNLGRVEKLGSNFIFSGQYDINYAFPDTLIIPSTVQGGLYLSGYDHNPRLKYVKFEYSENPISITLDNSREIDVANTIFEFDRNVNARWIGKAKEVICASNPEHKFDVCFMDAETVHLGSSVATATFNADCAPETLTIADGVEGIVVADGKVLTVPFDNFHVPASFKLMSGEFKMPADFKLNLADGDPESELDLSSLKFSADESSHPELYCGRNIKLDGYSLGRLNSWSTAVFGENVTEVAERCFDGCAGLTTAVLSPSIKTIDNYAFKDCTSLGTIEFSENLAIINTGAYNGCSGIDKIVARGTEPPAGVFAFSDEVAESTPLFVPEGSEDAYADSDNFIMFDINGNIKNHADGELIENMELDTTDGPVDEYFTAGSQHHFPSLFKILYHLYKKVTGQGAPARARAAAPAQPSNDDLIWISSDPRVASIDHDGYVTFHTNDAVTFTAIATDGSGTRLTLDLNKDMLGDLDKNGVIDGVDVNVMISGVIDPQTTTVSLKLADMNNDGVIDGVDINTLISNIIKDNK